MTSEELFGNALWISPVSGELYPYLRKEFTLPAECSAVLTICGLGFFEVSVNGQSVSEDQFVPAVSDYDAAPLRHLEKDFHEETKHRVYVMRYDVTELLREGKNCIGVRLYPGWYVNERHNRPGRVRLCFRLVWESSEGSCGSVVSDKEMKWHGSEITDANFLCAEQQDLSLACPGYSYPDYSEEGWHPCEAVDAPDAPFFLQTCPGDRIIRHIRPTCIGTVSEGTRLYDCGEEITGWPVLCSDASDGRTVTLTMSEGLKDGTLDADTVHHQICTYKTNGKPGTFRSRSLWHAFRYFTVDGDASCSDVCVVHGDVPVTSTFSCSDPVINWIYDAFVRTQSINMHMGIPSDCPQIERRGYTGDGQLACRAVFDTFDAKEFYRKWIDDIGDCQDIHSGHVQYTAPYTHSGGGPGGWGCAIVDVPYWFWKMYGDPAPAFGLFGGMLSYFGYLEAHSEDGLIVSDQPGEWCLGDWCTPEKIAIPAPYVNGYFYIRALRHAGEIALAMGAPEKAEELRKTAHQKEKILTDRFFDSSTGDFCGNIQGANLFMLDLGLGDDRTLDHVVEKYRNSNLDTGIFGTDLLVSVLFENGYGDIACDVLGRRTHPSYGEWMELGATTLWEEWGDHPRSRCHPMFGAPVHSLFTYLLGIRQAEGSSGFDSAVISPMFNRRVMSAKGSMTTPKGRISVDWQIQGDEVFLHTEIDPGVSAEIRIGEDRFTVPAGKSSYIFPID